MRIEISQGLLGLFTIIGRHIIITSFFGAVFIILICIAKKMPDAFLTVIIIVSGIIFVIFIVAMFMNGSIGTVPTETIESSVQYYEYYEEGYCYD